MEAKKLLCIIWIIIIVVTVLISINFKISELCNYFTYWMLALTVIIAFLYLVNSSILTMLTPSVWMVAIFVLIGAIIIILYNVTINNNDSTKRKYLGENREKVPILVMTQIAHHLLPPFFLFLIFGWPKTYPNLLHIVVLILSLIHI